LAHALKLVDELDLIVVNISGRGDKDMAQAQSLMGLGS
jgi:tryptophan synthase beta subunit